MGSLMVMAIAPQHARRIFRCSVFRSTLHMEGILHRESASKDRLASGLGHRARLACGTVELRTLRCPEPRRLTGKDSSGTIKPDELHQAEWSSQGLHRICRCAGRGKERSPVVRCGAAIRGRIIDIPNHGPTKPGRSPCLFPREMAHRSSRTQNQRAKQRQAVQGGVAGACDFRWRAPRSPRLVETSNKLSPLSLHNEMISTIRA